MIYLAKNFNNAGSADFSFLLLELLLHLLPNNNKKEMAPGVKTSDCLSLIVKKFEVAYYYLIPWNSFLSSVFFLFSFIRTEPRLVKC